MGHEKECCGSNVVVSFLGGIVFGGIMGLLFTPVAGEKTRQTIHEKFDELKEKVKKLEDKLFKHEGATPPVSDSE